MAHHILRDDRPVGRRSLQDGRLVGHRIHQGGRPEGHSRLGCKLAVHNPPGCTLVEGRSQLDFGDWECNVGYMEVDFRDLLLFLVGLLVNPLRSFLKMSIVVHLLDSVIS